jgi:Protein of unknown function (DUF1822)
VILTELKSLRCQLSTVNCQLFKHPFPKFTMMFSTFADPADWILTISPDRQLAIWQQSQAYPTAWGKWNAYLNHLCLDAILPWLQADYLPTATAWVESSQLPMFWEVVNGSVITIGMTRIAIVPTESIDRSELEVPQEWVDIPSWAADYYLGVQISSDASELQIYGYATHQQLKTSGVDDRQDRTYCLEIAATNPDLNALWLTLDRYPIAATRSALAPMPTLTRARVMTLIDRLSNPIEIVPRLALPFPLWAAIVENPEWFSQLHQQRRTQPSSPSVTRLGDWLQGQIDPVWQALDRVLLPQQLAIAVRSVDLETQPQSELCRAKIYSLATGQIALIVGLTQLDDTESRIVLQLHPAGGATQLPGATQLRLLTIDGAEIGRANAATTETIQLQFRASVGEQFQVEIECAGEIWTESFDR